MKEKRLYAWLLCSVCFDLHAEPKFIRLYTHSLTAPSASSSLRRCHTQKHSHIVHTCTKSSALPVHTCSCKPQKSQTHTWTKVLWRNKSWKAGWSPFCFLSKSFIYAPQQQQRRHHKLPLRYGISFPTVRKKDSEAVCIWTQCVF